jgi:transposase-like protein
MSPSVTKSGLPRWAEADRLAALRSFEILDTEPEAAFDNLAKIAAHICDAPIALISLVDEKRQWFKCEFWFSERRNLAAAKRFLRKALTRHGRPERIVIDGSQTNREAILSCDAESRLQDRSGCTLKPIKIRQSQYLNNRIEQDHRAVKRRVRSMLGFKSAASARVILGGIELIHMMRKQQAKYAGRQQLSLAEQFHLLAA